MGRLGFGELLLILAIVLLFIGAKRLPELGRSLGQTVREFQKAMGGGRHHDDNKHEQ